MLSLTANAAFINCAATGAQTAASFAGGAGSDTATCAAYTATSGSTVTSIDLRYIVDYSLGTDPSSTQRVVFTLGGGAPAFAATSTVDRSGGLFATTGGILTQTISVANLTSVGSFTVGELGSVFAGGPIDQGSARVDIQYNETSNVPEPATIVFLGGGLLALGVFGRRRAKA